MLDLSGVNSFLVYPKTSIPKREDENKKAEKDVVLVIRIELKKDTEERNWVSVGYM